MPRRRLIWIAVPVLALALFATTRRTPRLSGPSDTAALSTCETLVRERLKAPATASFTGAAVDRSTGHALVRGAVDAHNAFGALLRSRYVCELRPDNDVWSLVDLTIE